MISGPRKGRPSMNRIGAQPILRTARRCWIATPADDDDCRRLSDRPLGTGLRRDRRPSWRDGLSHVSAPVGNAHEAEDAPRRRSTFWPTAGGGRIVAADVAPLAARNTAYKVIRSRSRRPAMKGSGADEDHRGHPGDGTPGARNRRRLGTCRCRSARQSSALLEGRGQEEAARLAGCPQGTLARRSMEACKAALDPPRRGVMLTVSPSPRSWRRGIGEPDRHVALAVQLIAARRCGTRRCCWPRASCRRCLAKSSWSRGLGRVAALLLTSAARSTWPHAHGDASRGSGAGSGDEPHCRRRHLYAPWSRRTERPVFCPPTRASRR